jgi:hypothetical protein
MRAAVVRGDDLDVLVLEAAMNLVLNAQIGKVNRVVKVRQVMFAGPVFDLVRVAVGPPVAVRSVAVAFLQEALIVAFQLAVELDTNNARVAFSEAFGGLEVGGIYLRVVTALPWLVGT